MTRIPSFAEVNFDSRNGSGAVAPATTAPWQTPEGIAVQPAYGAKDIAGFDFLFLDGLPGLPPYLRGPYPTMYVQRPWTVRQYSGFSTAEDFERLLSAKPRRRPARGLHRLRPRHASRLRLRPSARDRRRGHGGRRHQFHLRHAHPVRRHPARPCVRLHDHERGGAAGARALHRRRRGAGRAAGETLRDHPERHPERVHGAQHLYLSAHAFDAHRVGHLRLHQQEDAEIQLDLDLGLSHAGGRCDGRPRARLHARRRHRICARGRRHRARRRCLCTAAFLLLGDRHELLHGDRQDARRAPPLGEADARRVHPQGPALARAAHPLPDERLEPCRAGRVQQRGAHLRRGHGGDARPHPVAAHQRARRGAGAAHRFLGAHRPQHPADAAAGIQAPPASSTRGAAASMSSASPTISPPAL